MSRITTCFETLKAHNKKALIPYITAGDPDPGDTVPLAHALVQSGANIIELGVPFSDPMADGPVIQRASERALAHHVSLHQVLDMVREFRDTDNQTPIVLMGYLNPVEVMGYESFAKAAADAGVDGVLTVDMPPEEAEELGQALMNNGLDPIYLIAPTTSEERIQKICDAARGYVYYVSLKGVTGAATLNVESVAEKTRQIRARTDLPIGVGFGIKDASSAAAIAAVADAVVVGSALIQKIEQHMANRAQMIEQVATLISSMRVGMDSGI
ncbi:MAG: tryptophan synthase subunit alpha [Gammaproteobacteria bacterium SG8_15]|nr:MAG: tryptophan synthase subunit alpha [Gammaproteobacteria bacterium SG8_15]